jgi:uncharacterized protein YbjT (DUF2867 family)
MSSIKTVALNGASGSLGAVILRKLLDTGKFNVTVLRRTGSETTYPEGANVVDVDYSSHESLVAALKGQDAVISAISGVWETQIALIDAAVAAGVKRFLPSEFGSDTENPKVRNLPMIGDKVKITDYVTEKSKTTGLTYTAVASNAFLDWGLEKDVILKTSDSKPLIVNGGNLPFSTTTLDTIGDAVVGVLTHPEETKNRHIRVHDMITTQNELLAIAKEVAPNRPWAQIDVDLDSWQAEAGARLAKGEFNMETVLPFLTSAIMAPGYGGEFKDTENKLLGIKEKTREDVVEIFKGLLK